MEVEVLFCNDVFFLLHSMLLCFQWHVQYMLFNNVKLSSKQDISIDLVKLVHWTALINMSRLLYLILIL